jgi:hypothetical protein
MLLLLKENVAKQYVYNIKTWLYLSLILILIVLLSIPHASLIMVHTLLLGCMDCRVSLHHSLCSAV